MGKVTKCISTCRATSSHHAGLLRVRKWLGPPDERAHDLPDEVPLTPIATMVRTAATSHCKTSSPLPCVGRRRLVITEETI